MLLTYFGRPIYIYIYIFSGGTTERAFWCVEDRCHEFPVVPTHLRRPEWRSSVCTRHLRRDQWFKSGWKLHSQSPAEICFRLLLEGGKGKAARRGARHLTLQWLLLDQGIYGHWHSASIGDHVQTDINYFFLEDKFCSLENFCLYDKMRLIYCFLLVLFFFCKQYYPLHYHTLSDLRDLCRLPRTKFKFLSMYLLSIYLFRLEMRNSLITMWIISFFFFVLKVFH